MRIKKFILKIIILLLLGTSAYSWMGYTPVYTYDEEGPCGSEISVYNIKDMNEEDKIELSKYVDAWGLVVRVYHSNGDTYYGDFSRDWVEIRKPTYIERYHALWKFLNYK